MALTAPAGITTIGLDVTPQRVRTSARPRRLLLPAAILVAQLAAVLPVASQTARPEGSAPREGSTLATLPPGTPAANPFPTPIDGARPLSQPEPSLYADEQPPTLTAWLGIILHRKILPALPGAILLLFFSALFGSINFYSDLREEQRSLRHTWRYLTVWVFFNYTFSMIALLLILPDNVAMTSVSRALAVYCIAVAALPEITTNLRLQLGRSETRALDLYKYKSQVSSLITGRMQRATLRDLGRAREALEHCYADDPEGLAAQLAAFVQQAELGDEGRAACLAALEAAPRNPRALLDAVGTGPAEVERVLHHFGDEIARFRQLPVCTLLSDLEPAVSLQEAQQLVGLGITTRRRFVWRTRFPGQRRLIAKATDLTAERLRLLHFSSRTVARRRLLATIGRLGLVLAMAVAVLVVIGFQTSRTFVTYDPRPQDLAFPDAGVAPGAPDPAVDVPPRETRP